MEKIIKVSFPFNKRIDVNIDGFTIKTDQRVKNGGDESAPTPFALFLSSIGSCAGIYALNFCNSRDIDVEGMSLSLRVFYDVEASRYKRMIIDLHLPDSFPDKYRNSIIKAMDLCDVKKHLIDPPDFEIVTS